MLELLADLPDTVIGVRAVGEVEGDDYDDVLVPAIKDRLDRHDKVRLLYVLGAEFTGYEAEAMWGDTKLGLSTFNSYDRIAIVTDAVWLRRSIKAFGWLIPGDVRVFHVDAFGEAREWITG
jgi:SpoIIAA-like